jgi:hypothetical protein
MVSKRNKIGTKSGPNRHEIGPSEAILPTPRSPRSPATIEEIIFHAIQDAPQVPRPLAVYTNQVRELDGSPIGASQRAVGSFSRVPSRALAVYTNQIRKLDGSPIGASQRAVGSFSRVPSRALAVYTNQIRELDGSPIGASQRAVGSFSRAPSKSPERTARLRGPRPRRAPCPALGCGRLRRHSISAGPQQDRQALPPPPPYHPLGKRRTVRAALFKSRRREKAGGQH